MIKPLSIKKDSSYIIEKSNYLYHKIHIIAILTVFKDNTIFSIGFD